MGDMVKWVLLKYVLYRKHYAYRGLIHEDVIVEQIQRKEGMSAELGIK